MLQQNNKADQGNVQIHRKVIADIARESIAQIEGVRLAPHNPLGQLAEILGQERFPGIEIRSNASDEICLQLNILVQYGLNIPDVARQVQDAVRTALERTTNISLKEVNVNVQGIERGKK